VREAGAGRCGFLVTSAADATGAAGLDASMRATGDAPKRALSAASSHPLPGVSRCRRAPLNGPFADAIRQAVGDAWIAPSYEGAAAASRVDAARDRDP